MRIVMSSGHAKKVRGATGHPVPPCCEEVTEARRLTEAVATALRNRGGHTVTVFHDDVSTSVNANLNWLTSHHNAQPAHDIDISFHMNCYDSHAHGCEVLYVNQTLGLERATKIVNAICKVTGLTNRGPKLRTDLAFLNNTTTPGSVLIETAFCDNVSDCQIYLSRFDAIADAITSAIVGEEVQPGPTPPLPPQPEPTPPPVPTGHPQLSEGSEGPAVVHLQQVLGVPADGDFGQITSTQVEGLQRATGCTPYDGIVGNKTWAEVDSLELKLGKGERLPANLITAITEIAQSSPIDGYQWPDRGISPPGFIAGMCLCYAVAVEGLADDDDHAIAMAKPLGTSSVDALKHYESELKAKGCTLDTAENRLRSLWVLKIGAAMRESSGRYPEGRDLSASNVEATTCEAGIEQASWNVSSADPSLPPLLDDYWDWPNGFRPVFAENVDPTYENLDVYGTGAGAKYQFLAKLCPLFAVFVAGVALRTRKDHFGPVKRKEVTINKDAWTLLKQIDALLVSVA